MVFRHHNAHEICMWFGIIHRCFPHQLQDQLLFNTYVYDPKQTQTLCGVVGDSLFTFSQRRNINFYIFDFVNIHPKDIQL